MLGMGSGQPNRVESLRIAMRKAGNDVKGAALASDAFFPFGKCYCHIKYLQYQKFTVFCCVMNNTFLMHIFFGDNCHQDIIRH